MGDSDDEAFCSDVGGLITGRADDNAFSAGGDVGGRIMNDIDDSFFLAGGDVHGGIVSAPRPVYPCTMEGV